MKPTTIAIVAAAMKADSTVSEAQRDRILATCQSPDAPCQKSLQKMPGLAFVTPKQAANILQASLRTVWRLAGEGKLRRVKLGHRTTRFPLEDIRDLVSDSGT